MLTLTSNAVKQLSSADIDRLVQLLGISEPIDAHDFLENPEDEQGFYEFFHDVLDAQKKSPVISLDWKWDPEDLFYLFTAVLSDHTITLIQSDNNQADNMYSVTFELDGDRHTFDVTADEPNLLLEYIDSLLKDGQFIDTDFLEDSYNWLRVPKLFGKSELDEFCAITGCKVPAPASAPARQTPAKLSFNRSGKQSVKIFFKPRIQVISKDGGYEVGVNWAGRVLPGQTIEEGIATELKAVYGYSGRFTYRDIYFLDYAKDRKGNNIERYGMYITLLDLPEEE